MLWDKELLGMGDSGRNVLQPHAGYCVAGTVFPEQCNQSKQVLMEVQAVDWKYNLDLIFLRKFFLPNISQH